MVVPAIGVPGPFELVVVLVIVLVLFGAGKLPEVFSSFGKGLKAFKDAQKDEPPEEAKLLKRDVELDDAIEVKSVERERESA